MRIFNLAAANIRENKSAAASLFVLILIAALLLNTGLTVMTQIHSFFNHKVEELEAAHVSVITRSEEHGARYEDFFKGYAGISGTEAQTALLLEGSKLRYGDTDMSIVTLLLDADAGNRISPLRLIEELETTGDNDIYLPYSFRTSGNYKLGDTLVLHYMEKQYVFRVGGFFETTMFGTNNMGISKFVLPNASFRQLTAELGSEAGAVQISAVLADSEGASKLAGDFRLHFSDNPAVGGSPYWEMDVESAKSASTITVNIISMIIVAFAAVIVMVAVIVIMFRVSNSIEDGMVNIGVLKAIGYKSGQITGSIILQYMMITLIAGIVGVALSYSALPLFGGMISSLSGLLWHGGVEWTINVVSVLIVTALVLAATAGIALRIRKLPPVSALRGGMATHSFRRNPFPLDRAKGGLHFLLACKTMLANRKQNLTIALIMAAVTFASVFSITLYYNIAADKTAFIHLVGVETSDVMVFAKPEADGRELQRNLGNGAGVDQVTLLDLISVELDGMTYYTNVSDDFGALNNNAVYEGRYPKHDNEIAVSWIIAEQLGTTIGETVRVTLGEATDSYLITGLSQSINNMGMEANMTLAGVQKLLPAYTGKMFHVYLEEGADTGSFIRTIQGLYGDSIAEVIDVEETVASQTSIYTTVVFAVMIMILVITTLVVALILYLVIKMMLLKRKKEYGIMRANGFTSLQLMSQVSLSFIPVVAIGVSVGCLLGYLYTNSLLELLLSGAGIRNVRFAVDLPLTVALGAGILLLAYLVSMLVAARIKRISAYELITE